MLFKKAIYLWLISPTSFIKSKAMSSPPNYIHHLLLLLSLLLIPLASTYTITEQECHHSLTPQTCLSCVESDTAAEKADRVGVAMIVVGCMGRQAQTLSANMTTLGSHEKDKKLRNTYMDCSKKYSNAKGILDGSAKKALKNRDFDNAERFVVTAMSFDDDCYQSLDGKVPSGVMEEMTRYEELAEAACRIIERLTWLSRAMYVM